MYQLNQQDEFMLMNLDETASVTRLSMLEPSTIQLLQEQKIETIGDLIQLEPLALMPIYGLDEAERDKLLTIVFFLFNGAYDNLHG